VHGRCLVWCVVIDSVSQNVVFVNRNSWRAVKLHRVTNSAYSQRNKILRGEL
jgi:hypothetical protein